MTGTSAGLHPHMALLRVQVMLTLYERAMQCLRTYPQELLSVLLIRDQLAETLRVYPALPPEKAQQLITLDVELRQYAVDHPLPDLADWRKSFPVTSDAWWWHLDQSIEAEKAVREEHNDLRWNLITGFFMVVTIALALEIIRRLFDGALYQLSVLGAALTILLTGGAWSKQAQEFVRSMLEFVLPHRSRWYARIRFGFAIVLFVAMAAVYWLFLPELARYFNDQGAAALRDGQLTVAQMQLQRAVALNPDLVVPYQNIGDAYVNIGNLEEAVIWYQQALEHEANFQPAYGRLGNVYNRLGEFVQAEQVLLAGLEIRVPAEFNDKARQVARYELFANLGWSYAAQEKFNLAQAALESAIDLEPELRAMEMQPQQDGSFERYRQALPHYYLAQVYEAQGDLVQAQCQWEESLRFMNHSRWADKAWYETASNRVEISGGCKP